MIFGIEYQVFVIGAMAGILIGAYDLKHISGPTAVFGAAVLFVLARYWQ